MLVDGKQIAQAVIEELKQKRTAVMHTPTLGIVVGADDPVTSTYVSLKMRLAAELGVEVHKEVLPPGATTAQAVSLVREVAHKTDGVVVQLPLPAAIDTQEVLGAIPPERDVDALNPTTNDMDRKAYAPVAEAIREIFTRYLVEERGKKAVVVGQGQLVGAPAAALLARLGAQVSVVTLESGSLQELVDADIVVLGAGSPGLVKPEMLKKGVVLIDAGTSEQSGKMVGDADPACADVASVFTPVPGGVGPIGIAMLFKNLFTLIEKK